MAAKAAKAAKGWRRGLAAKAAKAVMAAKAARRRLAVKAVKAVMVAKAAMAATTGLAVCLGRGPHGALARNLAPHARGPVASHGGAVAGQDRGDLRGCVVDVRRARSGREPVCERAGRARRGGRRAGGG